LLYPAFDLPPGKRAERILALKRIARERLTECAGSSPAAPLKLASSFHAGISSHPSSRCLSSNGIPISSTVGAYSLVGMGVLFAGFLRVPLTSVFMVLEVSGNYSIILPIILANTLAFLISRSLQPVGIFEIFTQQDGLDLPSMEEQREESGLHIEDALQPVTVLTALGADTLDAVSRTLSESHATACLIRLSDDAWYAMTAAELTAASATLTHDTLIQRALQPDRTPPLFPDMPLDHALHFFPRWPLLPVLNRASCGTLEGMLTLDDVLRRYRVGE